MADPHQVSSFLTFGYTPRVVPNIDQEPWGAAPEEQAPGVGDASQLVARGIRVLREALRASIVQVGDRSEHVLSLSGGVDSRVILAALLEAGLRDRIVAVTFGTPGTLDYDIGALVAGRAGVRHEAIDLSQVPLRRELLEETVREGAAWTYLLNAFYHRLVPRRYGKEAVYWSGYMGDALAGSHARARPSPTWDEALDCFVAHERFSRSVCLAAPGFSPRSALPREPLLARGALCYDDQLDLAVRQHACIAPIVLAEGFDFRVPFLHPRWVRFILSAPHHLRVGQRLFGAIVAGAYPGLFALPVKKAYGLPVGAPRWRVQARRLRLHASRAFRRAISQPVVHHGVQYADPARDLRERQDMAAIVRGSVDDLKRRGIGDWIDMDRLWSQHQGRRADHARALLALTALQINLRVQQEGAPTSGQS